jgi:hypothetical protein
MQRTENDELDEIVCRLQDAVLDANLAVHSYILSHGGELQNRDYFTVSNDSQQLTFLIDFFREDDNA